MKKYLGKAIFCLILGLSFLSAFLVIAQEYNESDLLYLNNPEIEDLNQKIEDNKTKIENLKKAALEYAQKTEEYKGMAASLKNQLGLLDNQMIKLELDIKTIQLQIDKAKLEIEAMNYKIKQQEDDIEKQKANIIEYIKQIARDDQKSYLEILILNESFSEFFNHLNYLEQIQADIQQAVDRLQLLKATIEVQKADIERSKNELEDLKIEYEIKESKLLDDQKAKELVLLETKTSEIQFQQLLTESRQKQNEIDSEILNLQNQVKSKLERLKKGTTIASETLIIWPIDSKIITSYFHDPEYPFRYIYEHPAIDIRSKQGTQIKAPAEGYVARAKDAGFGYSYIILIHDNGLSTVYGHVSAIYVKEDTYVNVGDVIGLTGGMPGTRGAGRMTTGPHLHFEVRLNGLPVNPLEYLP